MGGIAIGEQYTDLEGTCCEVVAVDMAVEECITLRPAGGGEQRKVPLREFRSEYSYVHPGATSGPVADAARSGYEGEDADA